MYKIKVSQDTLISINNVFVEQEKEMYDKGCRSFYTPWISVLSLLIVLGKDVSKDVFIDVLDSMCPDIVSMGIRGLAEIKYKDGCDLVLSYDDGTIERQFIIMFYLSEINTEKSISELKRYEKYGQDEDVRKKASSYIYKAEHQKYQRIGA